MQLLIMDHKCWNQHEVRLKNALAVFVSFVYVNCSLQMAPYCKVLPFQHISLTFFLI